MKKGQPYSQKEDNTIVRIVKENPHNLNDAFTLASKALSGRNAGAVSQHYYATLRNKIPMLATGNDKILLVNTKNTVSTINASYFNAVMRDKMLTDVFNQLPQQVMVDFFMDNISKDVKADLFNKITKKLKH
jgi:hypothetical protein